MREPFRVAPLVLAALAAGWVGCAKPPRIELGAGEAHLSSMFGGACSVFVQIRNAGGRDALVGARVDLPGAIAEVHDVRDGRMVRAERVTVPANGVLELKPGSLHIMVFKLPRDARAGTELTLRLHFEKSGEKSTSLRIQG
ncbi:MAG TPA: copper chaperone PCu(A)C [Anaeromyxobacter sp.]|nr:copper chaperone PCu(A)C [Anaeromyxobacter sp.]